MDYTAKMIPTAYNWFKRGDTDKLLDRIIASSQQSRSILETDDDEPIETWNLCSMFGLFYEDNFDDSCEIKSTSLFSKQSFEARKEITAYYKELIWLVGLYQHNLGTPIASNILAPSVINYLERKSQQSKPPPIGHRSARTNSGLSQPRDAKL